MSGLLNAFIQPSRKHVVYLVACNSCFVRPGLETVILFLPVLCGFCKGWSSQHQKILEEFSVKGQKMKKFRCLTKMEAASVEVMLSHDFLRNFKVHGIQSIQCIPSTTLPINSCISTSTFLTV